MRDGRNLQVKRAEKQGRKCGRLVKGAAEERGWPERHHLAVSNERKSDRRERRVRRQL